MTAHNTIISMIALLILLLPVPGFACETDYMELALQGKRLFNGKAVCSGCHGRNGERSTVSDQDVARLNPQPTDLRNASALKRPTDEARYDAIRNGIKGTGMPSFRGMLYDQEIRLIIEYLEVLKTGGC